MTDGRCLPESLCRSLLAGMVTYGAAAAAAAVTPANAESVPLGNEPVVARFRGCESAGWCRFWIESLDPLAQAPYRVYPQGAPRPVAGNAPDAIAVRNRLNALLAGMIHQHKHIVLYDLRGLPDGTFTATVIVNGLNVASDPALRALQERGSGTRPP